VICQSDALALGRRCGGLDRLGNRGGEIDVAKLEDESAGVDLGDQEQVGYQRLESIGVSPDDLHPSMLLVAERILLYE
jgi:hypothetical protein